MFSLTFLAEVLEYTRGPRTDLLLQLMDQVRSKATQSLVLS